MRVLEVEGCVGQQINTGARCREGSARGQGSMGVWLCCRAFIIIMALGDFREGPLSTLLTTSKPRGTDLLQLQLLRASSPDPEATIQ